MNSVPWLIPGNWQWSPLGDVVHIAQDLVDPRTVPDAIHIAPNHMISGSGDLLPYQTVREDGVTSPKQRFQPGQILFSKIRPYLRKAALVDFEGVCSADVYPLDVSDGIERRYVLRWLLSPEFRDIALPYQGRSLLPKINQAGLASTLVPIPPGGEQRRIVAKVDSLFAKTKRAREELGHIPRLIERYKQAILAAAFRGDLTADWRSAEPCEYLQGDRDYETWPVPHTWQWWRISEVGRVGLGRQRSPKNHSGPNMRPYVRAANITWRGWDFSDVKSMNFDERDFAQFKLLAGDVLINEGSGSAAEVGKPAIWREQIEECCFQNTLLRVQPVRCSPEYLYYYFLFCALSGKFVSQTQGVNIHHIGKGGLSRHGIPLAPVEEQDVIVERLARALSWVDRIAKDRAGSAALVDRLDQSILSKAFRGELVPQDPNDEPATVLLERIRDEQPQTAGASQRGGRGRGSSHRTTTQNGRTTMANRKRSDVSDNHLSELLKKLGGTVEARALWEESEMDINEFYKLLRDEVRHGRIVECDDKTRLEIVNAT